MKRKIARPVVVEVKRTRSSPSSLANVFGRNSSPKNLWHDVSLRVEANVPSRPEPTHSFPPVAKSEPEARPVRRVLPSLLPMFVPSEPGPEEAVTETVGVARSQRAQQKTRTLKALRPSTGPRVRDLVKDAPQDVDEPAVPSPRSLMFTTSMQDRRGRETRHPKLRRGERWKRRLPRSCW